MKLEVLGVGSNKHGLGRLDVAQCKMKLVLIVYTTVSLGVDRQVGVVMLGDESRRFPQFLCNQCDCVHEHLASS